MDARADRVAMHVVPRIVVVGGGAGGLELASRLGRTLGRRGRAHVTLVDHALTHLWKPLLHEVAAGTLDSHDDDVDYIAQAASRGFEFRLGRMQDIDRAAKAVRIAPTLDERGEVIIPARTVPYDLLVVAVGSVTNDFGIEGVREHCAFLDSRDDADRFQRRLLESYMRAQTQTEPLREGQLNVAIVGAGATGVELAAELHHVARQMVAYGFDRIVPEKDVRLVIIEASDRILPALPRRLAEPAERELKRLNVQVHTGKRVTRAAAEGLTTHDGLFIAAEHKVWAAGIKAPDFLRDLAGLETNRLNQLVVRRTLQTTRDDDIFAFGDCASCPRPGHDKPVPPTAQAAHQQASLLVRSLARRLRGEPLPEYVYRDYGSLVSLSEYSTVGSLMGNLTGSVHVEGWLARVLYRSLYRLHQRALFGALRTGLLVVADTLTRPTRPRTKLH
ncbi:NAD(P)/FAD-dependent oxidoreductase [Sulfurifustis variabilis]|nr:NAD(P)/FAD-dependent oxidoreductase [Sulfurifustis variabilis]